MVKSINTAVTPAIKSGGLPKLRQCLMAKTGNKHGANRHPKPHARLVLNAVAISQTANRTDITNSPDPNVVKKPAGVSAIKSTTYPPGTNTASNEASTAPKSRRVDRVEN